MGKIKKWNAYLVLDLLSINALSSRKDFPLTKLYISKKQAIGLLGELLDEVL